jgi:hypothetical protein
VNNKSSAQHRAPAATHLFFFSSRATLESQGSTDPLHIAAVKVAFSYSPEISEKMNNKDKNSKDRNQFT